MFRRIKVVEVYRPLLPTPVRTKKVRNKTSAHQIGAVFRAAARIADVSAACGTIPGRNPVRGTRSALVSAATAAATERLRRAKDSPKTGMTPFKADRATSIHPS
jgi:hypothetical protein